MNDTVLVPKPVQSKSRLLVLGASAVIMVLILGLLALVTSQRMAGALASGTAPDFELETFGGETIRLSELRGKPVIVNFWASWCIPCREEAPLLQSTWLKYKDQGLVLIGVDYVDTDSEAKKFMEEFGITYPNGPDIGTRISQAYRITGVPESYFITREGKLLEGKDASGRAYGNWIGPIFSAAMEERVRKLLEE